MWGSLSVGCPRSFVGSLPVSPWRCLRFVGRAVIVALELVFVLMLPWSSLGPPLIESTTLVGYVLVVGKARRW